MEYRMKIDNCDMIVQEVNVEYYKSQGWQVVEEISVQQYLDSEQIELLAKLKSDELIEEEKQKLMSRIFELKELKKEGQLELMKTLGYEITPNLERDLNENQRIEAILQKEKGN